MRTLVICLAFCITCFPAEAERRALIVGVQAYDEVTPLSRTLADVEGYGEVFSDDLNFEVTQLIEPTFETFLQGLSTFTASVQEGDEVVFVFSGHGWSDGAKNFLVMRDAPAKSSELTLKRLTVDLRADVIDELRARNPAAVVAIIDACRNNPFDLGQKTLAKGLVPQTRVPGTAVVYAAAEGQTALDRLATEDSSPYSVFTRNLLPGLRNGSKPLMHVFDDAREATTTLARQVAHDQRPAIYSDLSFKYCLSDLCTTAREDVQGLVSTYERTITDLELQLTDLTRELDAQHCAAQSVKATVFFDFDSANLNHSDIIWLKTELEQVDEHLSRCDIAGIAINAYTDSAHSAAYSAHLTSRQAGAVQGVLLSLGYAPSLFTQTSFGESRPLVPTEDGIIEDLNRRTEVSISFTSKR